jgi:hypothetical protein
LLFDPVLDRIHWLQHVFVAVHLPNPHVHPYIQYGIRACPPELQQVPDPKRTDRRPREQFPEKTNNPWKKTAAETARNQTGKRQPERRCGFHMLAPILKQYKLLKLNDRL